MVRLLGERERLCVVFESCDGCDGGETNGTVITC